MEKNKILIIEDNPVDRNLLKSFFRDDHYLLLEAHDGEQGLQRAHEFRPDIILLDLVMPGIDGFEVCKKLKQDGATKDIPIIMISSSRETISKVEGLETGAIDYITKPPYRDEVQARVRTHLRLSMLSRSLQKANEQLREKQKKLDQDLVAAAEIQLNLLPKKSTESPLGVSWYFEPCTKVGGDIFNINQLDENHLAAYIVDVSGHGVPAAMITALVAQYMSPLNWLVKRRVAEHPHYRISGPAELMTALNQEFPFERFNKFFTMIYLIINFHTGDFSYCCAGHPPMLLLRAGEKPELFDRGGPPVGIGDMAPPYEEETGRLEHGDRIYLFSDGIMEQEDPLGRQFGLSRIIRASSGIRDVSLEDSVQKIVGSLKDFSTYRLPDDDLSLLAIEY